MLIWIFVAGNCQGHAASVSSSQEGNKGALQVRRIEAKQAAGWEGQQCYHICDPMIGVL